MFNNQSENIVYRKIKMKFIKTNLYNYKNVIYSKY